MGKVTNPNDIVGEFVQDYRNALDQTLVSVFMYGSAVTHEYRPGISDINMGIVMSDTGIDVLQRVVGLHKKWSKRAVSAPFFMTEEYIRTSLDTYPVEFLDMRSNYRVLFGKDALADLDIKRSHLRLQCERELKSIALHVRKGYVIAAGNTRQLRELSVISFKKLLPVLKALLLLHDKAIPKIKSEIIGSVEVIFGLGASVLSDLFDINAVSNFNGRCDTIFRDYVAVIDSITVAIDNMQ